MFADRLRLIRQARGLSLDALSEAMGRRVTKQAISKYENGDDFPSPGVLLALAGALGVAANHLIEESHVKVEPLFYRKKSNLGGKERERLTAMLSCYLEEAVRIRQLVNPAEVLDLPIRGLPVSNLEDAEAQAAQLRKEWSLGDEPLGTAVDVLEDHGVTVCLCEADGSFDGLSAIARDGEGAPCGAAVLCRTGLTRERQRLNLAHELAHIVLKPSSHTDEEAAAWRFAGAFTAPRERLLADVGQSRRSVSIEELTLLKRRYGMSIQALLMRLHDLGVLSDEAKRQAFIQISQMGMRQREPGDTAELESPQWFRRTVLRAVSEGLLGSGEASRLLGEEVKAQAPKRNQFIHLIASLPPEERAAHLEFIGAAKEDDQEWLDASLDEVPE